MAPEAYWTNLDFKTITAGAVAISGVAFPFAKDFYKEWRSGRSERTLSQAKAAETTSERVDRLNREQYANLLQDRDYQARRVVDLELQLARLDQECETATAGGRAMTDWAHFYRHAWIGANQRFRSLVTLFEQLSVGTMTPERAAALVTEIKSSLPDAPPQVPLLRDAAAARPPA